MSAESDPYEAPKGELRPVGETTLAPCFRCGSQHAFRLGWTWWGGQKGAQKFHHVRCAGCGQGFNAVTGGPNTKWIFLYTLVPVIILTLFFTVYFSSNGWLLR